MTRKPTASRTPVVVRYVTHADAHAIGEIVGGGDPMAVGWAIINGAKDGDHIGCVAERDGRVVGFMTYRRSRSKASVRLMGLAVHPDYRRNGVGSQLVDALIDRLWTYNTTRIVAVVRERNLTAQQFFRARGFLARYVRPESFDGCEGVEDEYVFVYQSRDAKPESECPL